MMKTRKRYSIRHRGLSMFEVIISLTLVTTILFVSLSASANMMRNRSHAQTRVQGEILAGYLLDEISVLDFSDPAGSNTMGLDPGELSSNRSAFDDVDDYHLYSQSPPRFRDGQQIQGFSGWRVDVQITSLESSGQTLIVTSDVAAPLRAVGVTVTSPDRQARTFRAMISNVGTDFPTTRSFERLRRVNVTFSSDRNMSVVVPMRNTPVPVY